MKNITIYRCRAFLLMCLMAIGLFSVTSCGEDEETLDTKQIGSSKIELKAYGPTPALRGGELRFIGNNMDKVTAVVIPGIGEISDFLMKEKLELRVQIPQDAEVGFPSLITPQGEIKALTPLTFEEPISISGITTSKVKAGEKFTIEGDYLNLIMQVVFQGNAVVEAEDFITHTRKKIEVTVPLEARSGVVMLSNGEDIPIEVYSGELEATFTEPVISAVTELVKPAAVMTVTGKDLDLIASVRFSGDIEVTELAERSLTSFEVAVPADTKLAEDGKAVVTAITYSGLEFPMEFDLVAPVITSVTPTEGLRADDVILVKGTDLDLITSILFAGMDEAVAPISLMETELTVAMPATATSGDLILNTASGSTTSVVIATLKPEFTAFANDVVSLGSDVTLHGENLDLVAKVVYTGGAEVEVTPASGTELTIAMPTTGTESGVLTLVMANGESIETTALTINAPEFCYIPVLPGEDAELKGGEIFSIEVANGDKLTGVEVDGNAVQFIINANTLVIAVPQMANANTKVKLISSNGSVEYSIAFVPATNIKNEIWKGLLDITWNEGARVVLPASAFKDVPAGARMVLNYAQKADTWGQAQINYADFTAIDFTEGDVKVNGALVPTDVYGWEFDNRSTPLVLTQEILDNIQAKQKDCDGIANAGIIIQGSDLIFSSITLEWEISLEQDLKNCIVRQDDPSVLMPFPISMAWDDSGRFRILIDKEPNLKNMKLVADKSVISFYVSGTGQLQINDANWDSLTTLAEWNDSSVRVMQLVLTQEIIDCLKGVKSDGTTSTGLVVQGDGMTVSKITLLP